MTYCSIWFVDAINKNVITWPGGYVYWSVNLLSSRKTGLVPCKSSDDWDGQVWSNISGLSALSAKCTDMDCPVRGLCPSNLYLEITKYPVRGVITPRILSLFTLLTKLWCILIILNLFGLPLGHIRTFLNLPFITVFRAVFSHDPSLNDSTALKLYGVWRLDKIIWRFLNWVWKDLSGNLENVNNWIVLRVLFSCIYDKRCTVLIT